MKSLFEIARNDVPAAVAFVRERWEQEMPIPAGSMRTLFRLQDDSNELEAALDALHAERSKKGLFAGIGPADS